MNEQDKTKQMEEINDITKRYDADYITESLKTVDDLNLFAATFFKDVAEIYDCITRIRNVERNPTGFSLDDAPILGLLTKVWKLLKEIVSYYEQNNAEIISILERPLIESSIISSYLLINDNDVIEDYRKCSYKDRLRILRELNEGSRFYETKAGKRILKSVQEKMDLENLTQDDFNDQKANRWRLQGKTFFDIFGEISEEDLYKCTYGMMSEAIHGSWNDSMDFCLHRNDDNTFSAFPFYHPADIRYLSPTLRFCNEPYRLWLQRIDAADDYLFETLDWVERVNTRLFMLFDQKYDG